MSKMKLKSVFTLKYGKDKKIALQEKGLNPILGTGGIIGYTGKYLYDKPSVLLGRKGSIENTYYMDRPFWTVDTLFYTEINENIAIPKWVYYYTKVINFNIYKEGTGVPSLTVAGINNILIEVPPLETQQKIVNILSSFDDKIELNNEINKKLEEFAQLLYHKWFVDFEFPNEDGEPYKSSGGEFVDGLPIGWEMKKLSDISLKNKEKIKNFEEWKDKTLIDASNMPSFDMCLNEFDLGGKMKSNIYKVNKFDILFNSIRTYLGKAGFSPIEGVVTGTIHNLKPVAEEFYSFLLVTMLRKEFFEYTIIRSKGTKMPVIGWNELIDYSININTQVCKEFNDTIFPLILLMQNNIEENQNLKEIRDLLLPKLMSGEINVDNLDI